MELNEFITTVLNEIADGVKNSQAHYKELGGLVNPSRIVFKDGVYNNSPRVARIDEDFNFNVNTVEFEIALGQDENSENSSKIGVLLSIIGGGVGNKDKSNSSYFTKVKFSVAIKLPSQFL